MIGVYLSVCLCVCVCVFVCHQHYVKSYGWIWMKLSGNIGNSPRKNWLTFERDPDPDTDFGSGSGENGWTHFHETFKIRCPYGKDEHMWFWRWFGSGSDPDQSEFLLGCIAQSTGSISMKFGGHVRYEPTTNLSGFGDDPDPDTDFGSGFGGNGYTHFHEIFRICCCYE